jgi:hypothetical protein
VIDNVLIDGMGKCSQQFLCINRIGDDPRVDFLPHPIFIGLAKFDYELKGVIANLKKIGETPLQTRTLLISTKWMLQGNPMPPAHRCIRQLNPEEK